MGLRNFFKKLAESADQFSVVEAYEADLYPVGDASRSRKAGEIEFVRFKPGHTEFDVELDRSAGIPVGDEVAVLIHGVEVCRITIDASIETDFELRSKEGDEVPPIQIGDQVEITHHDKVVLTGVFRDDD